MAATESTARTAAPDIQRSDSARAANDGQIISNTRRPADVALKQQRMKSWQPLLDANYVIVSYLLIGIIFVPTGVVIRQKSEDLIEIKTVYESYLRNGPTVDVTGCEIGDNPNQMYLDGQRTCQIRMQVPFDKGDLEPPVLIHYELENFYQNYRTYIESYDYNQLFGQLASEQSTTPKLRCEPLTKIPNRDGEGFTYINPCGLIANTLFNDVISLESIVRPDGEVLGAPMVETGIAWKSDLEYKFRQPNGFNAEQCQNCDDCDCDETDEEGNRKWSCKTPWEDADGNCFRYFYPEDDITQYLYETYPMVVDPIQGVTNEHFVVWMRSAALSHFRKLYGYVEQTIPAGSVLTFNIMANFAVERFQGSKALVVSNSYIFGGKNHWLGTLFIVVGAIAALLGVSFFLKNYFAPRKMGDKMYLKYKEE